MSRWIFFETYSVFYIWCFRKKNNYFCYYSALLGLKYPHFLILDGYTNPYQSNSPTEFELSTPNQMYIGLYNSAGQQVRLLESRKLSVGRHEVSFDTADFAD